MEKTLGKVDPYTRVLLTGASGTLGWNVAHVLQEDPRYHLYLPLRPERISLFQPSMRLSPFLLDLRDAEQTREAVARIRPHVVIHCAATGLRPPRPAWFEMTRFNVDATLQLFECCCALPTCHFIYISTGLVYREQGRPLTEFDPIETLHPYGASKAAADSLLRAAAVEFGRSLSLLRPFSFTGPHDGGGRLFPSLLLAAAHRVPFRMSPGGQIRDFCSVGDIARAVAAVVASPPLSQIQTFNLGSGSCDSLRELVTSVSSALKLKVELQFGALPYHPLEPMHLVADIDYARSALHWAPEETLAYAVWTLARQAFPDLAVRRPQRELAPREALP